MPAVISFIVQLLPLLAGIPGDISAIVDLINQVRGAAQQSGEWTDEAEAAYRASIVADYKAPEQQPDPAPIIALQVKAAAVFSGSAVIPPPPPGSPYTPEQLAELEAKAKLTPAELAAIDAKAKAAFTTSRIEPLQQAPAAPPAPPAPFTTAR